ncbi:hypothetical protein F6R98_04365 [Candidatus Methylospira mobilis]|uniref:Lipoprotein n=1 Tax=Candidatus Methylospira mobilis TaxID=1808979 RepID=A0A5Q0BDM8_9GAMM|nr:hypothetical protein [Candidatus Methylospira mobilis]QFY41955.1 hypothetical protein F6R98_04365 [Candidatus Methylospira mobilis]WNV02945.1 hypothetical protein RP726_10710 [Candidatus Methylospira mobilis]
MNKLIVLLIVFVVNGLSSCTWVDEEKMGDLVYNEYPKGSSPLRITLIDDNSHIKNPTVELYNISLEYDLKEAYLNGIKSMLMSIFSGVDISSSPVNTDRFYAIPYFDYVTDYSGKYNAAFKFMVRIDIFESDTGALVKSYRTSDRVDFQSPHHATSIGMLNAFTFYSMAPVTMPIASKIDGEYGKNLIEATIKNSLDDIRSEINNDASLIMDKSSIVNCYSILKSDPSVGNIASKIAIGNIDDQSVAMMSNDDKPTFAETKEIEIYKEKAAQCWGDADRFYSNSYVSKALKVLHEETKSVFLNLLTLLENKAITYGEFARMRQSIASASIAAREDINIELSKETAPHAWKALQIASEAHSSDNKIIEDIAHKLHVNIINIKKENAENFTMH